MSRIIFLVDCREVDLGLNMIQHDSSWREEEEGWESSEDEKRGVEMESVGFARLSKYIFSGNMHKWLMQDHRVLGETH